MKTVYYAHPMSLYDTPQEKRDIETLRDLGFTVVNPNNQATADVCSMMRAGGQEGNIMRAVFRPMVQSCNALAFRAFPDGSIPAGVAGEIDFAREAGRLVFELPVGIQRRRLTVSLTREVLAESGQR